MESESNSLKDISVEPHLLQRFSTSLHLLLSKFKQLVAQVAHVLAAHVAQVQQRSEHCLKC